MSSAFAPETDSTGTEQREPVASLRTALEAPVQFVGFWTAVTVPFVIVGLFASGSVQQFPLLLTGLLVANVMGLVLGKDYKR